MLKEKLAVETSRREEAQREFARVEQETKDQITAMAAERQRVEAQAQAQREALEQEQQALKVCQASLRQRRFNRSAFQNTHAQYHPHCVHCFR